MRAFFAKIIKPLLALALAGAVLASEQGCTQGKPSVSAGKPGEPRTVALSITEKGYEPSPVTLQQGQPVTLVLTRTTDKTCATEIVLDEYHINTPLPLNQPVEVSFTPTQTGKLVYGCAMGKMIRGEFMVE